MVQPRRRNARGSDEDGSAPRRSFLSAGQRQDKAAPCALGVPSSPEHSGFASWRKTSWSRARWHSSYPERVGSGSASQPDPESFRLELFSSFDTNTSLKFFLLFPCAQHHFDPPPCGSAPGFLGSSWLRQELARKTSPEAWPTPQLGSSSSGR